VRRHHRPCLPHRLARKVCELGGEVAKPSTFELLEDRYTVAALTHTAVQEVAHEVDDAILDDERVEFGRVQSAYNACELSSNRTPDSLAIRTARKATTTCETYLSLFGWLTSAQSREAAH
jgi:hypothetical protein